jgi:histidine triad (HIT) family protein
MTIFSKIIAGEIPSYKVAENADFYAFLDINPLIKGHTLVVPKKEVDYIYDLDDKTVGELFVFSKRVAEAIQKAFSCKRIGIAVIGLQVPHAHIHLVPLNKESDINFSNPKLNLPAEEFETIAAAIASKVHGER